jgi:hypothetical protein
MNVLRNFSKTIAALAAVWLLLPTAIASGQTNLDGSRPLDRRVKLASGTSVAPAKSTQRSNRTPARKIAQVQGEEIVGENPFFGEEDFGDGFSEFYDGPGVTGYPRTWAEFDYLSWATKGFAVPPLVTVAPTAGTGALGSSTTSIVFGDDDLNADMRGGARFTLGASPFYDPQRGLEGSYFFLGTESTNATFGDMSGLLVARPFFNVEPATGNARDDAELVSLAGTLSGNVTVNAETDLQGAELSFRRIIADQGMYQVDFLVGYRFMQLEDMLNVSENLLATGTGTGLAVGTTIQLNDLFDTSNDFHGGNLGLSATVGGSGRWSLDTFMKLAVGSTSSRVSISGMTTTTVPSAGSSTSSGGLLSQPSNIGVYRQDQFSMIPELGATLRYAVSNNLQATFGYNFIYWSRVVRPGDAIDTDVNLTQQPPGPFTGSPRPAFDFETTDFWAQGISVGLLYTR